MQRTVRLQAVLVASLLALLSLNQGSKVSAQADVWRSIWPEGGSIGGLAIDPVTPTTLYTTLKIVARGVFKSTNGGGSWTAINTGLPNFSRVLALAIDPMTPTTLYAGTYGGGLFKLGGNQH